MMEMQSFKCCGCRPYEPAPEPCGKKEIAAHIGAVLKQIGEVSGSGDGGSLRSSRAWECFCWRVLRDSSLGLKNELLPDKVWRTPLILKSDSFRFTGLFMFLAGSLWVLVGGGVACLKKASDRQAICFKVCVNSWFNGKVKKTPCDRGPDESTERGKHTKRCQSNSEFEEIALFMSLLSPEAKEGCSAMGMQWIGWLTDLRDWI